MPRTLRSRTTSPKDQAPYDKHEPSPLPFSSSPEKTPSLEASSPVTLPCIDNVIVNPSDYVIVVDTKINTGATRKRLLGQPYRTGVYIIHRKKNKIHPAFIKSLEAALRNPQLAKFADYSDDDLEEPSHRSRRLSSDALQLLSFKLYQLNHGMTTEERREQGIFFSTSGPDIAKIIDLAKQKPSSVHCIATVLTDNEQADYWGFTKSKWMIPSNVSEPFRMPTVFEHDDISASAIALGSWKAEDLVTLSVK